MYARPAALLFDLDGTLTRPVLDFDAIRRGLGLPVGVPILEAIEDVRRVDPTYAAELDERLHDYEREAAARATAAVGAKEIVAAFRGQGGRVAVVTRNATIHARRSLEALELDIPVLVTRDDAPPKPDPRPLLLAMRRLGVEAGRTWMVGDGRDDIWAGSAAGCAATVRILGPRASARDHAAEPPSTLTVEGLPALVRILGLARV